MRRASHGPSHATSVSRNGRNGDSSKKDAPSGMEKWPDRFGEVHKREFGMCGVPVKYERGLCEPTGFNRLGAGACYPRCLAHKTIRIALAS